MKGKDRIRQSIGRIFLGCFVLSFLLLVIIPGHCLSEVQAKEQPKVMFISSYSYSWATVPDQIKGISAALGEDVAIDYEFMNTKVADDREEIALFYKVMQHEMQNTRHYAAIIVGDDAAFDFAMQYQNDLFAGIPIIYEGVNNEIAAEEAYKNGKATGVIEMLQYADNLKLAQKLFPQATEVVLLSDNSASGQSVTRQFGKSVEENTNLKFSVINSAECTRAEYAEKLAALDQNTILFFGMCSADGDGVSYTRQEEMSAIKENAKVPVFSMTSVGIGEGLFGGKILSDVESGKIAGYMAGEILNGKDPHQIAMVSETPAYYCFDATVMEKYGITMKQLPKGSVILNQNLPYWKTHAERIIRVLSAVLIIFLFLAFHAAMLYLRQRGKRLKEMEEKNRQLGEAITAAQRANIAKTAFLFRMSHEIRTPMNSILGMTSITRQHLQEPERIEENLNKIESSSKLLLNIINEVLDMSAIENDKIKISNKPFDLHELINTTTAMYGQLCSKKGVDFVCETREITQWKYMGDEFRLDQILNNLLSNALKFTQAGGMIHFIVTQKEQKGDAIFLQFEVSDTGCGMSQDMLSRLFHPFEQENSETASQYGGSGLGMSITKNLVSLMEGAISVESHKDQGTKFTVSLPLLISREQINVQTGGNKKKEYNFSGHRILLVDDTEFNLDVAVELLELVGFQVTCARNGEEAVETFVKSEPGTYEVILMDVQMPIMNGHDATRMIRKLSRRDAETVPILAMTANAFTEDISASFEAGMNDHITKPIDIQKLYALLDKYIIN